MSLVEQVIIIDGETIVVQEVPPEQITVAEIGAQGIPGPPGPSGGTGFVFVQNTPLSVWHINHGLQRFPSVTVVDSLNDEVEGDVVYVDGNNITLTFSAPFSGTAYLN